MKILSMAFARNPHPVVGKFIRWTKPNFGQISYMNEDQTIRIEIMMDIYTLEATANVSVGTRKGQIGSHKLQWGTNNAGNINVTIATDIVTQVYKFIDNELRFEQEMGLDTWFDKPPEETQGTLP